MSVSERIHYLYEKDSLSQTEFCDKIGVRPATINRMLSRNGKPSFEVICKILEAYPNISPYWLLLGRGEMRGEVEKQEQEEGEEEENEIIISSNEKRIIELEQINSMLLEQINLLHNLLKVRILVKDVS
jgi:transcriptional regulator with XRE-family HTH domain